MRSAREAESASEGERCRVCVATVYTHSPELQRMCHMVRCPYWYPGAGVGPEWLEAERGRTNYSR